MAGMRHLARATEAQIRDLGESGQISVARIVRSPDGYYLTVSIRWMKVDLLAYTTRRRPRSWASLDRLLVYLVNLAPELKAVELMLAPPGDWDEQLSDLGAS